MHMSRTATLHSLKGCKIFSSAVILKISNERLLKRVEEREIFSFSQMGLKKCLPAQFGHLLCDVLMHYYLCLTENVMNPKCTNRRTNDANRNNERVNFSFNLYKKVLMIGRDLSLQSFGSLELPVRLTHFG